MKVYWESGGIAPRILALHGGEWSLQDSVALLPGKEPLVPIG
jgi:hypothetical protein